MATTDEIRALRLNIGDGQPAGEEDAPLDGTATFYSDAELAALLDAAVGIEPRARVAALRPMLAEARKAVDFTDGDYKESASQLAKGLEVDLAAAEAEVAKLDGQDAATARAKAPVPVAVPNQWVF